MLVDTVVLALHAAWFGIVATVTTLVGAVEQRLAVALARMEDDVDPTLLLRIRYRMTSVAAWAWSHMPTAGYDVIPSLPARRSDDCGCEE